MAKPSPSCADHVGGRDPHVAELQLHVALLVHVAEDRQGPRDREPGRAHGHEDLALLTVRGGLPGRVLPITMSTAQLGCIAPEIHHLRPLRT